VGGKGSKNKREGGQPKNLAVREDGAVDSRRTLWGLHRGQGGMTGLMSQNISGQKSNPSVLRR